MTVSVDTEDRGPTISAWLVDQRRGALDIEAGERLVELVEAVRETGKAGKMTIEIAVKPGKGGSVEVADKLTAKLPEHNREVALWFVAEDGSLTRYDPSQPSIPFLGRVNPVTGEVAE